LVDAGVCCFNMGEMENARTYFQQALEVNTHHPNALYNMGVVNAQLGNMDAVLENWEKLIAVAPNSGPAQAARQMIEQIRNSTNQN
ncbi:MAG: tetratricopeptide repeat protein, partial [Calditrichia bacterium]